MAKFKKRNPFGNLFRQRRPVYGPVDMRPEREYMRYRRIFLAARTPEQQVFAKSQMRYWAPYITDLETMLLQLDE